MKKLNATLLAVLMVLCGSAIAQAQTKTVTLVASNTVPSSYDCSTNQVITINSFLKASGSGNATLSYFNGFKTTIRPIEYGQVYSAGNNPINIAAVFTAVTNIAVTSDYDVIALTFTVTTPTDQSSIPANAVVIPTDATGPVQIVLESSADLVNWTSALPGTYGNTYTNRFFRVRAVAQ